MAGSRTGPLLLLGLGLALSAIIAAIKAPFFREEPSTSPPSPSQGMGATNALTPEERYAQLAGVWCAEGVRSLTCSNGGPEATSAFTLLCKDRAEIVFEGDSIRFDEKESKQGHIGFVQSRTLVDGGGLAIAVKWTEYTKKPSIDDISIGRSGDAGANVKIKEKNSDGLYAHDGFTSNLVVFLADGAMRVDGIRLDPAGSWQRKAIDDSAPRELVFEGRLRLRVKMLGSLMETDGVIAVSGDITMDGTGGTSRLEFVTDAASYILHIPASATYVSIPSSDKGHGLDVSSNARYRILGAVDSGTLTVRQIEYVGKAPM